jgi:hypothetical protein
MSAKTKEWLATDHTGKRNQAQQTLSFIGKPENRNRTGFAPDTSAGKYYDNEAIPKFQQFDAAWGIWKDKKKRNEIIVKALEDTEKAFIPTYRMIYKFLKANFDVTNTDLQEMGLPPRSEGGGGQPSPISKDAPEVHVELSDPGEVTVHVYPKGKKLGAGKEDGQHGFECGTYVGTEPPKDWEDLNESFFSTRSYIVLKFKYSQRGQTLWFAVRWENTRGEKGPWSIIFAVIIP